MTPPGTPAAETPTDITRQWTVLIVEHDPAFARALARAFGRAGFGVRHTSGGGSALEEIVWHRPDVAVADFDTPPGAGSRLLDVLRQQVLACGIPLLVLAGAGAPSARGDRRERGGADAWLTKPLLPDEVVAAARHLVSGRRAPTSVVAYLAVRKGAAHPPAAHDGGSAQAHGQGSGEDAPATGACGHRVA